MNKIKAGDMVRIKERTDWPSPPGYPLADSEGEVLRIKEEGFVTIRVVKTNTSIPKETNLTLRLENLEKVKPKSRL
jgi:hypothetical protein